MKLLAQNKDLILDQPATIATATIAAAGTTLTVKNNGGFAQNDFILLGKIGEEKTEIKRITAAVTAGTSLTIAGVTFAHDIDTPVYKIDYDQVAFYNSATTTAPAVGSYITNGRIALDPTQDYTYFEDTVNTTGYGFTRFYDATAASYSVVSIAVPYTGYTKRMLRYMRNRIRRLINEPTDELIKDDEIDEEINTAQEEFAHLRLWSVLEDTKSFSTVANQYEYSLASDVHTLYDAKFDTQPLAVIDVHRWNILRWDSDISGDPTHICMWGRRARLYPYPSTAAGTTAINDADGITAADTTITVDATSSFPSQGRIIIESEVISYTGTTSTTFTGCTRGEEETTAATHANDITVTERDIIYHFQENPDDLTEETAETPFLNTNPMVFQAASELALRKPDETLHDRLTLKAEAARKKMIKSDESKYKSSFPRVKDADTETVTDTGTLRNPNNPPQNITGV